MSPEEAADYLNECAERIEGPMEEVLRECVEPLHQGFGANYIRRQDHNGTPWPEHAPSTVKRYGPHPLLILKGDMIAATSQEGAPGNITEIEDGGRTLVAGISSAEIPYAATQNYGRDHIPQREFFYADEQTLDTIEPHLAEAAELHIFGPDL